jgi:hypothetical protein
MSGEKYEQPKRYDRYHQRAKTLQGNVLHGATSFSSGM